MGYNDRVEIDSFIGEVFTEIENNGNELVFKTDKGYKFLMYHDQECCEDVRLEDICGDLNDLLNTPIMKAEEVTHGDENPEGVEVPEYQESFTWTFYKLATIKGYVDLRWYGESSGCYSESVYIEKICEQSI